MTEKTRMNKERRAEMAAERMSVEVWLGYYKQGDDLAEHLRVTEKPSEAFRSHAEQLSGVVSHLEKLVDMLAKAEDQGEQVEVDAGTHMIMLTGPARLMKRLVELDLVIAVREDEDE